MSLVNSNDQTLIGLGTAAIGRPLYINIRYKSNELFDLNQFKKRGIKILDRAFDMGVRYFDTAPGYGMAEDLLEKWIKSKSNAQLEVATKWGYIYTANFDSKARQHEIKDHSLNNLDTQWTTSKKLLPHLSTYQIHSATLDTGVMSDDRVLEYMFELKKSHGLLLGITTTGANQIDVLEKAAEIQNDSIPLFDVFQVTFNVLERSLLNSLITLVDQGRRVVVKEALANGRILPNENFQHYQDLYNLLSVVATKYDVGVDAVAIRYCMDRISPFVVLSGASTIEQLESNLQARTFKLSDEELSLLDEHGVSPHHYWEERKKLPWN